MVTSTSQFLRLSVACLGLAVAGSLHAQNILYVADGDNGGTKMLMGIDVTNGNIVFSVNTVVNSGDRPDAFAVNNSIWMIATYNSPTAANEYSLTGVSLGHTVTLPGSLPSQFLDGTTDGTHNYSLTWNGSNNVTVYKGNADWTNLTSLFTTSSLSLDTELAGITYDFASGNLWVSGGSYIYQISMAGAVVSSFTHTEGRGTIAYQRSTDTLWFMPNSASSPLLQYSKSGTLLQSLTVSGRSSNAWGAEFQAIPEPSTYALLALGGGLLGIAHRRRRA